MKGYTVAQIAEMTGRSKRAVQNAATQCLKRRLIDKPDGRFWLFDEREKKIVVSMLVGRGKSRDDVDTVGNMF